METTNRTITDLEQALDKHKSEASSAITYHKGTTDYASKRHEYLAKTFSEVMRDEAMDDESSSAALKAAEELILKASVEWFDISSGYQQVHAASSWNKSPQPGPAYFMSGATHCVHMFCAYSCGITTGPSRFSRNLVYCRSERKGGSNSSDDTLSTLCDILPGGARIGCELPPLYRSGYDGNRMLVS